MMVHIINIDMKRTYNLSIFLRGFVVLIFSVMILNCCERDENSTVKNTDTENLFEKNPYNLDMQDFSLAVAAAVRENADFRKILSSEALKMFDGDYDVLMSDIMDRKVTPAVDDAKSDGVIISVRDLLQSHLKPSQVLSGKKSATMAIDELTEKYPYLQISIPVNAEEWDAGEYIPDVTFIPSDYEENITKEVLAYSPEGEPFALDAVNPPDHPVIVISMNERVLIDEPKSVVYPPAPFGLTGYTTESGIRLVWEMPDTTTVNNTTGYHVSRKGTGDPNYIRIATIAGLNNKSYDDNNVIPGQVYSYFVNAFYQTEISLSSNIRTMTAPQYPKPVVSFDAIQHAKNIVELRWQNDYSQYIKETVLSKYVVGVDPGYKPVQSFTTNQHDYFDTDIQPGKKTIYKIQHVTDIGPSNPKYDFIQAPYRDISEDSPVYIKQMKFTDWGLEGWLKGKPEFYITVTNVSSDLKTAFKVQDQIECNFSSRSKTSQVFSDKLVLNWRPGNWYDMLTFTALEYDRLTFSLTLKIGVGFNMKDTLKLGLLQSTDGVEWEIKFQNNGQECGNGYLDYFDNPESWITFPNYGLQILVSENDN